MELTILGLLSPTFPDPLWSIALADDSILLAIQTPGPISSATMRAQKEEGGYVRRLGLVALLLSSPAGYTTRLGAGLGGLDWNRKWVFAWTPTFPWNVGGNTRGISFIPHIRRFDAVQLLCVIQLLDFGHDIVVGEIFVGGDGTVFERRGRIRRHQRRVCKRILVDPDTPPGGRAIRRSFSV